MGAGGKSWYVSSYDAAAYDKVSVNVCSYGADDSKVAVVAVVDV